MLKIVNGAILTYLVIILFFMVDVKLLLNRAGMQLK